MSKKLRIVKAKKEHIIQIIIYKYLQINIFTFDKIPN
jgi:hypothetical protein